MAEERKKTEDALNLQAEQSKKLQEWEQDLQLRTARIKEHESQLGLKERKIAKFLDPFKPQDM